MKNFFQFLSESAAQQAARLGLQGDGHGGWYDRSTGEFVAKTEKGRLKFYNKRQQIGKGDPNQTELEKNISDPNFNDPALQQQEVPQEEVPPSPEELRAMADEQEAIAAQQEQERQAQVMANVQTPELAAGPPPVPKTKGTLTIGFGRFNPPHAGHMQLMDIAASSAESDEGDYIIVPSRSNDPKKNPLDPDTKISYMRRMYPKHGERIVNDAGSKTIFDVLKQAHADGYSGVNIVVGSDRQAEFEKLASKYNGQLYDFAELNVVSAGERDADSDDVSGMSASKLRKAAADGDFNAFRKGTPKSLDDKEARKLFMTIRKSMKVEEGYSLFEIAPKMDMESLRESYVNGEVFNVGDIVENINTGLVGRIIRRGANYLICVTEDNIMFKPWIKDVVNVNEWINPSGVPANQREVGTDAHREYVMKMIGAKGIKNFINKYRKK